MTIADLSLAPPVCREVAVLSLDRRPAPHEADAALFTLRLRSPGWQSWRPGQFVMIRPHRASRTDILWARPFSISHADATEVRIVFQVAGRGTQDMLSLERGETVTLWGPLGNAFAVHPAGPTLLLAGGIGIAPFVGYIAQHPTPETLQLEFGHRLPLDCYPFAECLPCSDPATGFSAQNHPESCTEDREKFLETIDGAVKSTAARNGLILACGPLPFLKAVQKAATRYTARAQLSLETRMACGVGACLGCVVKYTTDVSPAPAVPEAFSYVQTCTRGPVFWSHAIDLEE